VPVIYHPVRCSPGKTETSERTVMPESPPNVLRTYVDDPAAAPLARLQANAISGAQDVVIGMASSAPAASIGLTIAPLAAATAYGSGAVILLTAVPMLVIANAYRRLNLGMPIPGRRSSGSAGPSTPTWGSWPAG
jgi:hypothetical protein